MRRRRWTRFGAGAERAIEPPRAALYHGTGASLLASIRREGLRPDAPHTYGISRYGGPGVYATPNFDLACFYACDGAWRNFGDEAVVLAFARPAGSELDNEQLPPDVVVPPSALYLWTEYGWASLPSTMDDEAACLDCRAVLP